MGANYRMTEWQCGDAARAARAAARTDRTQEPQTPRACAKDSTRSKDCVRLRATPRHPRRRSTCSSSWSTKPRSAFRAIDSCALRAEGIPCGVGNDPVYRSALFPAESARLSQSAANSRAHRHPPPTDCPVAERLSSSDGAIPHEVLLGDERDVDDMIAAAAQNRLPEPRELALGKARAARASDALMLTPERRVSELEPAAGPRDARVRLTRRPRDRRARRSSPRRRSC